MISICCTADLRRRLKLEVTGSTPSSTSKLGNWYGHIAYLDRRPLTLMVSEPTRLALVFPVKGQLPLDQKLRQHLEPMLRALGITPDRIEEELRAMDDVQFCKTNSRSVLGTINDYKFLMKPFAQGVSDLSELSLKLSDVPCGPLKGKFPIDVARDALNSSPPRLRLVR